MFETSKKSFTNDMSRENSQPEPKLSQGWRCDNFSRTNEGFL